MKKIDGFTLIWWFIQAFTTGFMSVNIIPDLVTALNKTHRVFMDGVWIIMAAIMFTMFFVTTVTCAGMFVYNVICSVNKEEKKAE